MRKYFFILGILSLVACKELPTIIEDVNIEASEKVVLIEELTGASCPNCPKGTAAVESIISKYPENVIAIGIHGEFLANKTSKSKYDFRNEDAKNLENWFRPWFGKPAASVNRVRDADEYLVTDLPELWESLVEEELKKPLQLELKMDLTYDESTRKVSGEIAAIPLVDLNGDFNYTIYLTESKIIDAQTNANVIVENYEHNHVLRKTLTNFAGNFLATSPNKSQIIRKTFEYIIPFDASTPEIWKPENMYIIAMVSHNKSNNREVLQAVEKHVK